ncbi:hypothetical protein H0H87_002706 [Tephrocybe sp. NHM501043]|nr:hypothetical protein H0H87_002706 [Tephrocybe sp. NHM501043]
MVATILQLGPYYFMKLGLFLAECRQLGRSYALILTARDLREGLESLLSVFHENATHLSLSLLEKRPPLDAAASGQPFHFWLEALSKACDAFRERLNEFREYTVSNLTTTYMRHYVNDLADEMGKDLDNLVSAFTFFNHYGMPAMQYEQQRDTDILLGMSTASTFFSAVTATMLQTSLGINDDKFIISLVNTFWFCSLVLSIGAALNSLLAVLWKRTP